MGLQKTVNYKEVTINDAYHRIHDMYGKKEGESFVARFKVELAANPNADILDIKAHSDYKFDIDLESNDNIIIQAYNHLKTLDEFAGAIDA